MTFHLKSLRRKPSRWIPAALAFALLAVQVVLPWTALQYVTQDGPSHLYTALVARDLLLNSNSPYAAIYELQPRLITNWSTTVLMNVAELLFGPRDAEHAIASLCVLLGFFGIAYLRRSICPRESPWSPMNNFLLFSWFLWIGFYNFCLGMAIFPFVAGYYIRYARMMTWRRMLLVAAGLILLFFTHVLALGIALMVIGLAALWISIPSRTIRPIAWGAAAVAPAVVLLLIFIRASGQTTDYDPSVAWAWNNFPMHAFASSHGRAGEQSLLWPVMLAYMALGLFAMRRREWVTVRAAVFVASILCFLLYLFMPNAGFGGDEIKIRFAWATFILGCVAASTVSRLRPLRLPVALYVTAFLLVSLVQTWHTNIRNVARGVRAYMTAVQNIPPGSTFVRMRFPTEKTRARFGFERAALDPFFHLDSRLAAERRLVAFSDYQAVSRLFPVVYRSGIPGTKQVQLWDLEGSQPGSSAALRELLKEFPAKIDYVILVGDGTPAERAAEFQSLKADLDSMLHLVSTDSSSSFVRVYRR